MKKDMNINLYKKNCGLLYTRKDGKEIEVTIKRCFPLSHSRSWLSFRDNQDLELYLIEDIDQLNDEAKVIINEYLNIINFTIEINKVLSIDEDIELRKFSVETNRGTRKFQTKRDEWPTLLNDKTIIIQDLSGDIFKIKDINLLDHKSKKLLSTYAS